MTETNHSDDAALRALLEPSVSESGLYLEHVYMGAQGADRVLHVVVDLPEDETGGVSLDKIAEASEKISAVLDEHDAEQDQRPYTLDVSSRGVTSPLVQRRHFKRNLGRLINVTLRKNASKHSETGAEEPLVGRLSSVDEDSVTLIPQVIVKKGMKPKVGEAKTIKYDDIKRARVEIEFNAGPADEEVPDGH